MSLSVNTNGSALAALGNLNNSNNRLAMVQQRINSGLKVASAKDNSAVYSIAQGMRGELAALRSVGDSLNRGQQILNVSIAAGQAISDSLIEMKELAVAASAPDLSAESRNALNSDFLELRDQIDTIADNAEFNGINLIDFEDGQDLSVLVSADGASLTISKQILSAITLQFGQSFADLTSNGNAQATVTLIDNAVTTVNQALTSFGAASRRLDAMQTFNGALGDTIETGIGNLVDADLAKENAILQATQTKQQLGLQSLAIANQAPSAVLSLFR